MSRLTDLIAQAKAKDPQLGMDLEREFKALSSRRAFGLNFERHRPETVELPQRSVTKGDKVRVLPPRGSLEKGDQRLWVVKNIASVKESRVAHLELLESIEPESQDVAVDDLVVVAGFRDVIYPGLVSTGKVERGGDKPFHTVINGENYHALKALTYTHRGKVDAIYIDPPYNTGAKDWKYNNDYVEGEDLYRHSKWLAFMERRLLIAKELLNPADSVLIVTIDEKEYLRLGLLLEQMFPETRIQMVSSVINPSGSSRAGSFSRSDEYLFFVFVGYSELVPTQEDMLRPRQEERAVRWDGLARRGATGRRTARPNLFYPVFCNVETGRYHSVGDPIALGVSRKSVKAPDGTFAIWPIAQNGSEVTWGISHEKFKSYIERGYIKFGAFSQGASWRAIYFIQKGTIEAVENGDIEVNGKDQDGTLILGTLNKPVRPMSTWNKQSHSAGDYGSTLLRALMPDRRFPFPKSLYAVEDALRFFVMGKPEAIVLDFFAGSGTTAHAVMRLNRQDGGRRQCISVTNNEVAADEQAALRKQGLRPGDPGWEQWGICDYITKPRVEAAITGKTPSGEPIKGDYKFTDEFPMSEGFEENAEFFTLTYQTPVAVSHNHAFEQIAPLLWMRAGSQGKRIQALPPQGWSVVDRYGLLTDLDQATAFCEAVASKNGLRVAFIVTDDDRRFQSVARRLPDSVESVRLYESYLLNFRFANGE